MALPNQPHTQEQPVTAMPIHLLASSGEDYRPDSIQRRATLHEKVVQQVPKTTKRKRTAKKPSGRSSRVTHSQRHPAYKMAHDLGIEPERIEVTAEPPFWGAVIHNDGSWQDR